MKPKITPRGCDLVLFSNGVLPAVQPKRVGTDYGFALVIFRVVGIMPFNLMLGIYR